MKLIGKRLEIYEQLISQGRTKKYALRVSKKLSEGKTLAEARGHTETWSLFSYFDGVSNQLKSDSEILGMTTYDTAQITEKSYSKKGQKELFEMHQYMERELQKYLKLLLEVAQKESINIEIDTETDTKNRRFAWQLTDMREQTIRYFMIYEKGQFVERKMWESFDFFAFRIQIRDLKRWE